MRATRNELGVGETTSPVKCLRHHPESKGISRGHKSNNLAGPWSASIREIGPAGRAIGAGSVSQRQHERCSKNSMGAITGRREIRTEHLRCGVWNSDAQCADRPWLSIPVSRCEGQARMLDVMCCGDLPLFEPMPHMHRCILTQGPFRLGAGEVVETRRFDDIQGSPPSQDAVVQDVLPLKKPE
jgi:hypothetical protein